ncbi:hypothetical protein FQR65_LT09021 [Abscondita terminalis]|nr:hypothetical protein FQR65_LT09021 [Abscondita terminalis]
MTESAIGAENVSPVTLSGDWSRVARLLTLASLSAVGSIGNVFMISAVMIDDYLRKRGNAFVVNVALADLLVSGLVVPASAVVILAGLQDNLVVCRFQWFLAALCFLVTVLSLAATSAENQARLCSSTAFYEALTPGRITTVLLIFWTVCAIISGLQFVKDLSFDYCTRKYPGLIPYQTTVAVVFVFVPLTLSFFCYIRTHYVVRVAKSRPNFKPPVQFGWDYALMQANMYSLLLFIVFWLPFGVVLAVETVRAIPDSIFYNFAWLAINISGVLTLTYFITAAVKLPFPFHVDNALKALDHQGTGAVRVSQNDPPDAQTAEMSMNYDETTLALRAIVEQKYPTSVFCIIATEFCERFSFCGLRTILSLYLRNELQLSENTSTIIYHVFIMICYVVPIAGAVCADSYLGRYRTILYFSLIYLTGNILMCLASVPCPEIPPMIFTYLGLSLIASGTGGIKPCVAAFGGDQFHLPQQQDLLQQFFSIFYFSINLGGFVGMILTPILRKSVTCFGEDTCYPLGFGFPALLMVLALVLFMLGKPFYRLKTPKDNVMLKFMRCALYAITQKLKQKNVKYNHWLDHSQEKFPEKLIKDMKLVFAVLLLYTPLPIFWSLFDQQGSRWTFQASRMDGAVLGTQILPDQMQVVNPAFVLFLIPIFDRCFYPILNKLQVLSCPLHRMAIGGLVAGAAFLSAGILELVLETTYPELPDKNRASLNFINTLPCDVTIENPFTGIQTIYQSSMFKFKNVPAHNVTNYSIVIDAPSNCGDMHFRIRKFKQEVVAIEYQINTILVGLNEMNEIVTYMTDPIDFKRSLSGKPRMRIAYLGEMGSLENVTVSMIHGNGLTDVYFIKYKPKENVAVSAYLDLIPGEYTFKVQARGTKLFQNVTKLDLGGIYTLVIRQRSEMVEFAHVYTMSPPNTVNMLWLIPQYFLISVAEIMFGIAGLEFSFTQAPKCLKTVTIAAWYLSVAVGNFLVIIITQAKLFKSQAYEFFLFAILIVADMIVFTEIAIRYKIVVPEADSSEFILTNEETIPLIPPTTILVNRVSIH